MMLRAVFLPFYGIVTINTIIILNVTITTTTTTTTTAATNATATTTINITSTTAITTTTTTTTTTTFIIIIPIIIIPIIIIIIIITNITIDTNTNTNDSNHFLFSTLSENELDDVVDAMQDCPAREGDVIIKEGDPGDCFYILEEGTCEIYISDRKEGEINTGYFGDLSLMYNCPRAATVIAKTDCILWSLDRVFFRQAQVTSNHNHNNKLNERLKMVPIFENLETQSLNQLGRSLTKQSFEEGEYILKQGEPGEQFYVILSGTVKITRTGDTGEETIITTLGEGEFFGEGALIRKVPRAANVVSLGPVECYYLNSQDFSLIFGEIVEKLKLTVEYRVLKSAPLLRSLGKQLTL